MKRPLPGAPSSPFATFSSTCRPGRSSCRSEQTELAHIASLATHYSLAHPDKSVELRHGPKSLLDVTPVEALRERVFQVFGRQTLEDLMELAGPALGADTRRRATATAPGAEPETRLSGSHGFVSQPQVQKSEPQFDLHLCQWPADPRPARAARDLLGVSQPDAAQRLPVRAAVLDCDHAEVDVNVHPSKTEVRFRHGSFVHDFVRDTIREQLVAAEPALERAARRRSPRFHIHPAARHSQRARLPYSEFTQQLENSRVGEPAWDAMRNAPPERPRPEEELPEFTLDRPAGPAAAFRFRRRRSRRPSRRPVGEAQSARHPRPDLPEGASPAELDSLASLSDLRPLGQIHESFIIAAGADGLWIIDQHVAHERILFEQVLRQQAPDGVEMQQFLLPIVLELTPAQQVEYAAIADDLNSMGFETEPFGNRTIAVKAAPAGGQRRRHREVDLRDP